MPEVTRTKRRLQLVGLLLVISLGALIWGITHAISVQQAGQKSVLQTNDVLQTIEQIKSCAFQFSAFRHASVLTSKVPTMARTSQIRRELDQHLQRLRQLLDDNPEQLDNYQTLFRLIEARNRSLDDALTAFETGGASAYGAVLARDNLVSVATQLDQVIAAMTEAENRRLQQRRVMRDRGLWELQFGAIFLGFLATAAVFLLLYAILRETRARNLIQKLSQRAADQTQYRFRTLVDEAMPFALFIHDHVGRILNVNRCACDYTGYDRDSLLTMSVTDLEAELDLAAVQKIWSDAKPGQVLTAQGRHRRKNGSSYPVEVRLGVMIIEQQRYYIGVVVDLTDKQAAEREIEHARAALQHSGRLSLIGEIAATISHEVNQPLGAVNNYLQAAKSLAADQAKLLQILDKAMAQAQRASEVVRKVRNFAAQRPPDRQRCNMKSLIQESVALARMSIWESRMKIEINIPETLPDVLVDGVQIQQILLNLFRNASEAMAGQDHRILRLEAQLPSSGKDIDLLVSDCGPGIAASVRDQLFTSFVTSKPDGTGLGLSTSRAIAQALGGDLTLQPSARGASFRLTLPVAP